MFRSLTAPRALARDVEERVITERNTARPRLLRQLFKSLATQTHLPKEIPP